MKQQSKIFIGFAVLIGLGILVSLANTAMRPPIADATAPVSAASTVHAATADDKTQTVYIYVDHGYKPALSYAKSGEPTKLIIETAGVYDCTSSINIPALKIRKFLPATGVTVIDIPPQEKDSKLTVLCAMGMYSFDIKFN